MDTKILVVHRAYRIRGGEDAFLEKVLVPALKSQGIAFEVLVLPALFSGSRWTDFFEVLFMALGLEKLRPSYFSVARKLKTKKYTHLMLNNYLPTISLSLPQTARRYKIQVLSWVHNARAICANGLVFNGKKECRDCLTVSSRRCGEQQCLGGSFRSWVYAWIYRSHRPFRKTAPFINTYLAVSSYSAEFIRAAWRQVIKTGEPQIKIITPSLGLKDLDLPLVSLPVSKPFYLYLGRMSYEKGADIFADLSEKYPQKVFVMSGEGPLLESIQQRRLPNLKLVGMVDGPRKNWLLKNCHALVIPSRVPETASLVLLESDMYKSPVFYPEGGGAEELVKKLKRRGRPLSQGLVDEFQEFEGLQEPPVFMKEGLSFLGQTKDKI